MVCQAASRTKFKALKHENGIAGRTTTIVRVIACYQHLQNCQAEYFRQLLKPVTSNPFSGLNTAIVLVAFLALMVTAKESSSMSQMVSAWNLPDSDEFAGAQLGPNWKFSYLGPTASGPLDHLLYFNPSTTPTADAAFQGKINSNSRVGELFKIPCPFGNHSHPTENPYLKTSQVPLTHDEHWVSENPICAPRERKFLIFDRSGNHTKLFFTPSASPPNKFIASCAEKMDDRVLLNPVVDEKWDENDLEGKGELHENSEEIDALLYSDSDDDDDDDEVTSKRHIPSIIEDGLPKRQRLLDGRYKKSSWSSFESSVNPCNYKGGDKSSYVRSRNLHDGINSSERDKKVRIREALKVLGSIIPGLKTENPVCVIEKAIAYLESMKIEAEALGPTYPESKLVDST